MLRVRRVVTGHDEHGRSTVLVDEQVRNVVTNRPCATWSVIWSTEGFPVDNDGREHPAHDSLGTTRENGTVFRVVQFDPGVAPRHHRTHSIDYAVVISGEIEMLLDLGTVRLKAGDVLVQRGTVHDWINHGPDPCVIAFTLISAKPVSADGTPLVAHG